MCMGRLGGVWMEWILDLLWQHATVLSSAVGRNREGFCADPIQEVQDVAAVSEADFMQLSRAQILGVVSVLQRFAVECAKMERLGEAHRALNTGEDLLDRLSRSSQSVTEKTADHHNRERSDLLRAIIQSQEGRNLSQLLISLQSRPAGTPQSETQDQYWPKKYALALLHLQRGSKAKARKELSTIVRSGSRYRAADVTALAARACDENAGPTEIDEELSSWETTLAIETERPGALWGAAAALGRKGMYGQGADLLQCLVDLLGENDHGCKPPSASIISFREVSTFRRSTALTRQRVRYERARYLACDANRRLEALEEYRNLMLEEGGDSIVQGGYTVEHRRRSLERAWLLTMLGDHNTALQALEKISVVSSFEKTMANMCRANALMCLRDFGGALAVLDATMSEPLVKDGQSNNLDYRSPALQELRAILASNRAVLLACKKESQAKESTGAALASLDTAAMAINVQSDTPPVEGIERSLQNFSSTSLSQLPLGVHADDPILTAVQFNRSVLRSETNDQLAVESWLHYRKLVDRKDVADSMSYCSVLDVLPPEVLAGDLAVDHIAREDIVRLDKTCLDRQRATAMESQLLAEMDRVEKEWKRSQLHRHMGEKRARDA